MSRLGLFLIFGIILVLLGGCIWMAIWRIPDRRLSIFAFVIDGALMAVPIAIGMSNVLGGRKLWERADRGLKKRLERTKGGFKEQDRGEGRSLVAYLILPRNQEELLKALFIPVGFLVAWLLVPGIKPSADKVWYYATFFLVFEFFVYQARYLWNDVRDREVDSDPGTSKRRFSIYVKKGNVKYEPAIKGAFASFVVRMTLAVLVISLVLPYNDWKLAWHFGFIASVFVFALFYEKVRWKCDAIGREKGAKDVELGRWTRILVLLVGLGYGLRAVVGFWLGGASNTFLLVLLFIGASLFGSTLVGLGWALESTRMAACDLAKKKAHLAWFRTRLNSRLPSTAAVNQAQSVLQGEQSWKDPWSWPAILATAILAWASIYALCNYFNNNMQRVHAFGLQFVVYPLEAIILFEICTAVMAVIFPARIALALTVLSLSVFVIVLVRHFVTQGHIEIRIAQSFTVAALASLPLLVSCFFRFQSYEKLPDVMRRLGRALVTAWCWSYSRFAQARSSGENEPSSTTCNSRPSLRT